MKEKIYYSTKQREEIIKALKSMEGKDISINDLLEYFKSNDIKISRATLYRNLDSLVSDKIIRKYTLQNEKSARFEYLKNCDECDNHFHFKCENCGKLIHFNCDILKEAQTHLALEHGFNINHFNSVIYGECRSCIAKNKK